MNKNKTDSSTEHISTVSPPKNRLFFLLVIVFIFCSGNALGILMGALIWTRTGQKVLALGVLIGLSILGFLMALLVALFYIRSVTDHAKENLSSAKETTGEHTQS